MKCVCLDDYRQVAKKKMPKPIFFYIEGGSDDENTKKRNERVFKNYVMIPRILISTSNTDLTQVIFGHKCSLPYGIAPWAMGKLSHPKG